MSQKALVVDFRFQISDTRQDDDGDGDATASADEKQCMGRPSEIADASI